MVKFFLRWSLPVGSASASFANCSSGDKVVVMVYTERPKGPHVISLRKAEKHEARYYLQVAKENLG